MTSHCTHTSLRVPVQSHARYTSQFGGCLLCTTIHQPAGWVFTMYNDTPASWVGVYYVQRYTSQPGGCLLCTTIHQPAGWVFTMYNDTPMQDFELKVGCGVGGRYTVGVYSALYGTSTFTLINFFHQYTPMYNVM